MMNGAIFKCSRSRISIAGFLSCIGPFFKLMNLCMIDLRKIEAEVERTGFRGIDFPRLAYPAFGSEPRLEIVHR